MPVAISIQWKPLRDSHYVVASLQPGGAGLRQIFARQSTLREVQALVRSHPDQPFVGLLLGQRLDCSLTLAPYLLIESHVEVALASLDERAVSDAIRTLSGHLGRRNSAEVLGWYCTGRSTDATVSRTTAAVHAACFPERWQTVLTFGSGGNTGAFFLHDSRAARWFHAPFFEVTESKASGLAPKPTCVAWPAYLTTASVVPLVETPQPVAAPLPPQRAFVHDPVSPPARQRPVAPARPVVTVRRTPARDAIVGMGRAAVSARRSALDFAKILVARAIATSRQIAERFGRIRAKWAASAARRKAEAESARAREEERRARQEERRAKEAAARRAAQEEAQRQAAEAEKRRAVEAEARRAAEAEARRIAAEDAERRRAAEAEVKRLAAEAEAQRRAEEARAAAERQAEEAKAEAQRRAEAAEAEAQRRAAEAEIEARRREEEAAAEARRREETVAAEARRRKEEADAQRAAEAEAQRKAAAEAERRAVEIEARRKAAEQAQRKAAEEAERKAVEMEARRKAAEEAQRKAAEEEQRRAAAEAQRRAAEADARRQAAEVEARRQAAEAESRRVAEAELEAQRQVAEAEAETQRRAAEAEEDARRKAAAAEEHARRMAAEAEALRISVEVAAIRERLARPPVEGSKREAPRAAADHIADIEDTTAADGPYRYLALARREGFEVSESIERGSPDRPETVWLLHKKESGLRLIVVTTDEEVREASLHYNLRTDDDSLLRMTAPEHRDLESRTIYGREACLHDLRARCRRLSATGALERDWKVTPTFQQPVSSHSLADAATPQR